MGILCRNITINTGSTGSVNSDGGVFSPLIGDFGWKDNINTSINKELDPLFKKAGKALGIDWRLCAAHCKQESGFDPRAYNKTTCSTEKGAAHAMGLWQCLDVYWPALASKYSKGHSDLKYVYDKDIATDVYIGTMKNHLNSAKNAISDNDRILLAIQAYHDGHVTGTKWVRPSGNSEKANYVNKILGHYTKMCK